MVVMLLTSLIFMMKSEYVQAKGGLSMIEICTLKSVYCVAEI